MMSHRFLPMIILALMLVPQLISGQAETVERPKIGYVFSGGGAKGMAHVGY